MNNKTLKTRDLFLVFFSVVSIIVVFSFPRISQDASYHHFADHRKMLAIPNFWNVVTNLPFALIGVIALYKLIAKSSEEGMSASTLTLFIGVTGVGLGSAWYHYHPTNTTLVWDRIPMTITFMSYFSIIVEQYVNTKLGKRMLIPMLALGVFSVWYWCFTEQRHAGDLRLYGWIQFYPMVTIPLIVLLYPVPRNVRWEICVVVLAYGLAKVTEANDHAILNVGGFISGHSLKHLLASIAVLVMLLMVRVQKHNMVKEK